MNILLIGAGGRMGSSMQELLKEKKIEFMALDKDNRSRQEEFCGDVILDFSSADAIKENLALAKNKNLPIVIATTGHGEENLRMIEEYQNFIPIFISSNFSLLFNFLLSLLGKFSVIKNCDFIVTETHHKHKKDAPSGSCKEILKILAGEGINPAVYSFRVGEVVGRHEIEIFNDHESLKFSHDASSRLVFCQGALEACRFILDKPKGLYYMSDLIR